MPPADRLSAQLVRRDALLERLIAQDHEVLIVGGGINGAISALALASQDVRVALVERDDFAAGVSQESSNLIWGGFKYLQSLEVGLVSRLCQSRNRLARTFPAQIKETRFLAALGETSPYPPLLAAAGAHAYWALGRFATQRPTRLTAQSLTAREPILDGSRLRGAVEYSDYLLPDGDARFVLQLLIEAIDRGAVALSRIALSDAAYGAGRWRAEIIDELTQTRHEISAPVLINAAGPYAGGVAAIAGTPLNNSLVKSKGVHLVVPRVTESDRVLALFDDDQRLFFVIPMGNRSVIGTTDTPTETEAAKATPEDFRFLLEQANSRLSLPRPLKDSDIIAHRCGVRSLVERPGKSRDWMELSRRHILEVDDQRGFMSILGGKLSDCLNVGEEVVAASRRCGLNPSHHRGRWHGGPTGSGRQQLDAIAADIGLDQPSVEVLWRRHGNRAREVAGLIAESPELGQPLSDIVDYSTAELMVMADHEHIYSMEDFLRRRTLLAMLEPRERLAEDSGVVAAARILFGDGAADMSTCPGRTPSQPSPLLESTPPSGRV